MIHHRLRLFLTITNLHDILNSITENNDRLITAQLLEQHLPTIIEHSNLNQSNKEIRSDTKNRELLRLIQIHFKLLQKDIYDDFMQQKKSDWITILVNNKISPLSLPEINKISGVMSTRDIELEYAALRIQRQWRNNSRYQLHQDIFHVAPSSSTEYINQLAALVNEPLIKRIVYELAEQHKVVNHHVYHWTTWENLKNIYLNQKFYGHQILNDYGIKFIKNVLNTGDIENGDGKVICFCPYLVDDIALHKNGDIREQLIRLTLDLNQLDQSIHQYQYNQFFKIVDLLTPAFDSYVKVAPDLSARFKKEKRSQACLQVTFTLDNFQYSTKISKKDLIFYGNLNTINQFCLFKLLELVTNATPDDSTNRLSFQHEFYYYLSQLSEAEIKKILVTFCQYMTIFSEYNFNSALPLTSHFISAIYDVQKDTLMKLDKLSNNDYDRFLKNKLLAKEEPINIHQETCFDLTLNSFSQLFLHGIKMDDCIKMQYDNPAITIQEDMTTIPAYLFDEPDFLETRDKQKTLSLVHSQAAQKKSMYYF
jgi:hypothetical protein